MNQQNQTTNTAKPAKNIMFRRGIWIALGILLLIILFSTYSFLFCRIDVPPGEMIVVTQKTGPVYEPPKGGDVVLVPRGYRGIWEKPLGPGRHFLYPYAGFIFYSFETYQIPEIPLGKVGIVTSRGGTPLPEDRILAKPGEKGTWRMVLGPGWHLLNPRGYDIDTIEETLIKPGHVGVLTAQEGVQPAAGQLSQRGERGIQSETVPPGRYYINPREFKIDKMQVGYRQIMAGPMTVGTADVHIPEQVEFNSKDGFKFTTTFSALLLYKPEDLPKVVKRYGNTVEGKEGTNIENKIVIPQVLTKIKEEGQKFQGRELITGTRREVFQDQFTDSLRQVCDPNGVELVFSYIRRIDTEERLKDPIRKAKLAELKKETIDEQRTTAETETQLNISAQEIDQAVQKTTAEYTAQASVIDASTEYQSRQIEAETEFKISEIKKKTADIQGQIEVVLGQAQADAAEYEKTAKADGQKLSVQAFEGNAEAYRLQILSEMLNPAVRLRIRETGPGTLWTDLDLKRGSHSPADIRALRDLSKPPEAAKPEGN